MKTTLLSALISAVILIGVFAYGFKVGKMTTESKQKDKVVQTTIKIKDDTEKLKKELQDTKQKLKEAKKYEECNYILNYPVRKCLRN